MILRVLILVAVGFYAGSSNAGDVERGRVISKVAGCSNCHTTKADKQNSAYLAGGRAFKTKFGTFYSPNITPDPTYGIGAWSEEDLKRALRQGVSPDGEHYYPIFPYTSYTKMNNVDIQDLWAYLRSLPPIAHANRPHDVAQLFGWRILLAPWKLIYFTSYPFAEEPSKSAAWNRGAYIVEALAHCGECHTPRDNLGGAIDDMHMAGTSNGPDGGSVPNITDHKITGIGRWTDNDLKALFSLGILPDGDFVGSGMADVVDNISKLSNDDRWALIVYLKSLPAIENRISAKPKSEPSAKDRWQ